MLNKVKNQNAMSYIISMATKFPPFFYFGIYIVFELWNVFFPVRLIFFLCSDF